MMSFFNYVYVPTDTCTYTRRDMRACEFRSYSYQEYMQDAGSKMQKQKVQAQNTHIFTKHWVVDAVEMTDVDDIYTHSHEEMCSCIVCTIHRSHEDKTMLIADTKGWILSECGVHACVMCTHAYIWSSACMYDMYTCIFVSVHTRTHTHTHTRATIHIFIYVYIHACVCVYIYTYIYTYIHTYIYIYIYIVTEMSLHTSMHVCT
jgi:hypothetical protein